MNTNRKATSAATVSRRRFVTLVAAGSAALLAPSGAALANDGRTHRKHVAAPAPPSPPQPPPASAAQKEFDRQRAGTLATLKTLREFTLPPGGDLPLVFRPQRNTRQGR